MSTALIVSSPTQTMIWNASGGGTISAPVATNNVFLYDLYLMNALSEASVLSLTTPARNLSRNGGSLTLTNKTMSSNTPYVVYVHYKAKIILNKNNASVRVDNLKNISIQVANNGAFTMYDPGNNLLPGTSDGGVFYYFSTNSSSSISGQKGVRYDIGTGYQHKLNLALTDSFVLYAIYMKSYSSYSSSGFAQQYLAIPMGTTSITGSKTEQTTSIPGKLPHIDADGNVSYPPIIIRKFKYKNGLGFEYQNSHATNNTAGVVDITSATTKYITLPRGFTSLSQGAFTALSGLEGISFPSHSFTTFGDYACSYTALKNSSGDSVFFDVPKTTTAIGKEFISHTTALTSVTIGANIPYSSSGLSESTALHIHAFTNAPNLTSINGEGNYSSDDGILTDQYKHEYIRCPEGKTNVSDEWNHWTIWEYCFNNVAAKTISFWGGTLTAKTNAFSGMKGEELILHMTNKLDLKEGSIVNCSELLRLEFGTTYTDSSTTYTNAIGSLPKIEKIIFNKKGSATPASYTLSTIRSGVSWYYAASETDPVNSTATEISSAGIYTTRQIPNKPVMVETYSSASVRNTAFNSPNSSFEHTSGRLGKGYYSTLNEAFSSNMATGTFSIVTLFGDTTLTSTLNISANTDMLITTWDAGCVIKRGTSDVLFNIDGGKLTFDSQNLIVDGQNSNSAYQKYSLVQILIDGKLIFNNGTLQNNNATNGGAIYIETGATANISGGTIQGCVASTNGGAIYSAGTLDISGGNIFGTAKIGGGILIANGYASISSGSIGGNATLRGGAVAIANGMFEQSGGTIANSTAEEYGCGMLVAGGEFKMTAGEIKNNKSQNANGFNAKGGGIAVIGGKMAIEGGEISENWADYGGGIYVESSGWSTNIAFANIIGGTISKNEAFDNGGGVYLAKATGSTRPQLSVWGGTISANIAYENGGGIFADEGSELYLSHETATTSTPTIESNEAYENGGGIALDQTYKFFMANATITNNKASLGGGIHMNGVTDDHYNEGVDMTNYGGNDKMCIIYSGTIMWSKAENATTKCNGDYKDGKLEWNVGYGSAIYRNNSTFILCDNTTIIGEIAANSGNDNYTLSLGGGDGYNSSSLWKIRFYLPPIYTDNSGIVNLGQIYMTMSNVTITMNNDNSNASKSIFGYVLNSHTYVIYSAGGLFYSLTSS